MGKEKIEKSKHRHAPLGEQIAREEAVVVRRRNPVATKTHADEAEAVRGLWFLPESLFFPSNQFQ